MREVVLQHPLPERFADNRRGILDAEFLAHQADLARARRRRDAIDHAAWECNILRDPVMRVVRPALGEAEHRVAGDMAVFRQVVARHHRERRDPRVAPFHQRRDDDAEDGLWMIRTVPVGDDFGMRRVEAAGLGVDIVAAFGDRQRNDADFGLRHRVDQADGIDPGEIDHRSADGCREAGGIQFDDRGQPVLRLQLAAHRIVIGFHARADDGPVVVAAGFE